MNQPQLGSFESIAVAAIRPSHTNPRKNFDPIALAELQTSVSTAGVIEPLLLRPLSPYYVQPEGNSFVVLERLQGTRNSVWGSREEADGMVARETKKWRGEALLEIVSGERRWRASLAAGLVTVPGIVRKLTDAEALDIQMIENLQRADLHPVEEAEGYRALMASGAWEEDVAKKAGKSLAYVKQRIQLLKLEVDAKELFLAGHLHLDHALLLARLTPKDQERAVLYLLGIRDWEMKKGETTAQAIAKKLERPTFAYIRDEAERAQVEAEAAAKPKVTITATALRNWINDNVLLQLAGVPWDLADAQLLPVAGACTTCPKRTGADAALFSDITVREDVCTDPACFSEKRAAQLVRIQEAAKKSGSKILKLSSKRSNEKLAEPAVKLVPSKVVVEGGKPVETKRPEVVATKAVKEGQWVPSTEGACPATVQGVVTDGPNKGLLQFVCADQKCKVHKHQVEKPRPASSVAAAAAPKQSAEESAFRKNVEEAFESALLAEIKKLAEIPSKFLAFFFVQYMEGAWQGNMDVLCDFLEIEVPAARNDGWDAKRERQKAQLIEVRNHLSTMKPADYAEFTLALMVAEAAIEWMTDVNLTSIAEALGLDASALHATIKAKAEADRATAKAEDMPANTSARKAAAKRDGKAAAAGDVDEQDGE